MKKISFKKNRLRHALAQMKCAGWTSSVSIAALLSVNVAMAEDEDEDQPSLETIEVIGTFSGGLDRSLDVKRDQETIADAVVAGDIGKLPAVNVAEALQRVPGVTVVREAGEGQFISVRGLGPNFQAVTLNGMPLAYNENIRTSGQSGRQFRFRVLPADLIDGIVITKAPSANMMEGGIGSNVDIRTLNPLDRDNFFSATIETNFEEHSDTLSPKGSLATGWQNSSGTFGVMGGVSYQQREVQFERFGNGWGTLGDDEDTVASLGDNTFLVGVTVPGDFQTTLEQEKRDRMSAVGGLQWIASDNLELDMDLLYSQFNNEIAERRLTYQTFGYWDNLNPDTAVIENGRLLAGTLNGARIRNTTEFSDQAHENIILISSLKYTVAGWELEPKLSFSRATSDLETPLQRIEYRTESGVGNTTFDLGGNAVSEGRVRTLFSDLDLSNPATVPFRRYRIRPMNSEDEDTTFRFDATRDLDLELFGLSLAKLQAGFQISDRARDYQRRDRSTTALRANLGLTDAFNNVMVPGNTFGKIIDNGQLWTSADWDLWRDSFVIVNEAGEVEFDGVEPSASQLVPSEADLRNSYGVDENIRAIYARLDFNSDFDGIPVSGNFGLRYVETETLVKGTLVTAEDDGAGNVSTVAVPRTSNNTYRDLLPSLNLNFELRDDVLMRIAVGRTMTRPSLSELRDVVVPNSGTVSDIYNLGETALEDPSLIFTAAGGNPFLKPYSSWNVDMSLEWYFDEFGAFSMAGFYKNVSDYISADFESRTLPFAVNDGSTLPVDIVVSSPANIGDVVISGMEFGFTKKIAMGLGIAATATFATSKLELDKSDVGVQTAGIQGISDQSYSISPFYEYGPFEMNLSYTWRSDYLTDAGVVVTSRPTEEDVTAFYQKSYGTLDMGASFNFNDNYSMFMQAVNILDNHATTYVQTEAQVHQIHFYGRTINLGFRAKF